MTFGLQQRHNLFDRCKTKHGWVVADQTMPPNRTTVTDLHSWPIKKDDSIVIL
eukprot:m.50670 g.50670  ORF g.50670 m.50670 type:complete len:53 (+) comp10684_c0_seq4:886-1044(+)